MIFDISTRLNNAVKIIAHDVWRKGVFKRKDSVNLYNDEILLKSLVFSVLSSQIRFEVAREFTFELFNNKVFSNYEDQEACESEIKDILVGGVKIGGRSVKYRFPNVKARQLAYISKEINEDGFNIKDCLVRSDDVYTIRQNFIDNIPGLGMKQASMFLRDVGFTDKLAIIDSHVIKYMSICGMHNYGVNGNNYFKSEGTLVDHAETIGYPIGCVDKAIWVVMRTAVSEGML